MIVDVNLFYFVDILHTFHKLHLLFYLSTISYWNFYLFFDVPNHIIYDYCSVFNLYIRLYSYTSQIQLTFSSFLLLIVLLLWFLNFITPYQLLYHDIDGNFYYYVEFAWFDQNNNIILFIVFPFIIFLREIRTYRLKDELASIFNDWEYEAFQDIKVVD